MRPPLHFWPPPPCTTAVSAAVGDAATLKLPLGTSGDETLVVSLPERPFSALARLPDAIVKGLLAQSGALGQQQFWAMMAWVQACAGQSVL